MFVVGRLPVQVCRNRAVVKRGYAQRFWLPSDLWAPANALLPSQLGGKHSVTEEKDG
jgi:hypothetical protein